MKRKRSRNLNGCFEVPNDGGVALFVCHWGALGVSCTRRVESWCGHWTAKELGGWHLTGRC